MIADILTTKMLLKTTSHVLAATVEHLQLSFAEPPILKPGLFDWFLSKDFFFWFQFSTYPFSVAGFELIVCQVWEQYKLQWKKSVWNVDTFLCVHETNFFCPLWSHNNIVHFEKKKKEDVICVRCPVRALENPSKFSNTPSKRLDKFSPKSVCEY